MGDFSKGGVHKTDGLWWVIFKGGGSTQNRWGLMGDFSKGGVHKTDGFGIVFLLLLKIKRPGRLFRQIRYFLFIFLSIFFFWFKRFRCSNVVLSGLIDINWMLFLTFFENRSTYNSSTFPRIKKRTSGSPDGDGNTTNNSRVPKSASSNAPLNNGQKAASSRPVWSADSLRGEFIDVTLIKSTQGLGFTVIGGEPQFPNADFEDDDSAAGAGTLLQLKSIAPNGPAHVDGRLRPGDVLVTINDRSVLGYTHDQVIHLFQV